MGKYFERFFWFLRMFECHSAVSLNLELLTASFCLSGNGILLLKVKKFTKLLLKKFFLNLIFVKF